MNYRPIAIPFGVKQDSNKPGLLGHLRQHAKIVNHNIPIFIIEPFWNILIDKAHRKIVFVVLGFLHQGAPRLNLFLVVFGYTVSSTAKWIGRTNAKTNTVYR